MTYTFDTNITFETNLEMHMEITRYLLQIKKIHLVKKKLVCNMNSHVNIKCYK